MKSLKTQPLSKELVSDFHEKGFCTLDNVLISSECKKYIDFAKEIANKRQEPYNPYMNPDREYPIFRQLLCHPVIFRCLEMLLDTKVSALQSMLYYRPPGSLGRDMHQDNFYANTEKGAYIGTWLAFEESEKENGGLIAYPGSHQEDVLEIVEDKGRKQTVIGDFKNDRGKPCFIPENYEKTYLKTPAGACVFIHSNVIHGSEENYSKTRFRRVFAGHYIKQGYSFVSGTHAKRHVIDVYEGAKAGTKRNKG